MYRVVQEALSNVTRHAQTGEAWIRALPERNALAVEVEDHGSGVVLTQKRKASGAVSGAPAKAGLGILAMKERAQILGGEFSLETPAEGGTRVRIRIPIATVLHETEPE
ncbi:MAG: ATP-binding protein [Bryobacterales bacterium]|nr:ATP-binding protein [Bryobacterales bacterium]